MSSDKLEQLGLALISSDQLGLVQITSDQPEFAWISSIFQNIMDKLGKALIRFDKLEQDHVSSNSLGLYVINSDFLLLTRISYVKLPFARTSS